MTDRTTDFPQVPATVDLPALDARVLAFWKEVAAFETSVTMRPSTREYTFYDGPPFATGSPHYGHILQGIIKDIVPRYWTMRGFRVERRFGWDTHGLPVEMEVEKLLGVSGPRDIQELGIARFNQACREMVEHTTGEWETITERIGRWVDFDNDYKTMDVEFMESVWWVFRRLWDKGLIYQDFKVLPYSWGATTPLSNFEANLDYREVEDPAIVVRLPVLRGHGPVEAGDDLLIWTTTPWTLPGNLAVAVGEDIEYGRVVHPLGGRPGRYWIAVDRIEAIFGEPVEPDRTASGRDLVGIEYDPPFDYFEEERDRGAFRVIVSDDVTVEEGTGLVHMAPAYGEADFFALQAAGLDVLVDPVDAEARFTDDVPDVAGMNVKEADPILMDLLDEKGRLLVRGTIRHSYPFCWRTATPLIYKAIPTWFVAVERFRDEMVANNRTIHWVPEHIGSKRFGNWLENARDWAISRNRYWGSCIPVWQCDRCGHQEAMGSRAELRERAGVWLDDLHREFVDEVTYRCTECTDGTMRRVPEVLDCWFESGAMPYAQIHYPFENEERFARRFPADFIAEGLDQTRGWFYTLLVLATAISEQAPFQNCVVTGLILAEDGRKMSKSLKNYPDPSTILDRFGADALRAYLINSPIVRGEPLRFSEAGVRDVVRTVLLPLWNAYSFFTTYAQADGITMDDITSAPPLAERPEIDRWIVSVLQSLVADVNREMEDYRLDRVVPPVIGFVGHLTNWYIRRSRRRFWSHRGGDDQTKLAAFATLYEVLTTFATVAAPVLPFVTERLYQDLVRSVDADAPVSVHHLDYPTADGSVIDRDLERSMAIVRTVVNLGRGLRKRTDLRVRQPLRSVTIATRDPQVVAAVEDHADLIADELNVKDVRVAADERSFVDLTAKANFKVLGPRLGKETRRVAERIEALGSEELESVLAGGTVECDGVEIAADDIVVTRVPRAGLAVASEGSLSVALDTTIDEDLRLEGIARDLVNRIQSLRKDQGLAVTDRVTVRWNSSDPDIVDAFGRFGDLIAGEVLAEGIERDATSMEPAISLDGHRVVLAVKRAATRAGR